MLLKKFLFATTLFLLFNSVVYSQYSSIDFGLMRMNYKNSGVFEDTWLPGFSINAAGVTFKRYAGEVPLTDTFPDVPQAWKAHAGYWNLGFTKTFTNIFDEDVDESMKRPIIVPFAGGGFGAWKTHDGGAWFNLAISGGASINLMKGIAIYGGLETGLNFKGSLGAPISPLMNGVQESFPRFFGNLSFGIRAFYQIGSSIDGYENNKERYHSSGWYDYQYESGGFIYSGKEYSEGGTWSDYVIITTNEIISLSPVIYFPRSFDGVGNTKAFGGKLTFRTGLLNADIQFMKGQVGFIVNSGSFAGSVTHQSYWNISQTSFAFGINAFNIFAPFKGPSLYRFIIGQRFGISNMEAIYVGPSAAILPTAYNDKKIGTRNFFMSVEIGRFGISWDFIKSPTHEDHESGALISAYYMIPINQVFKKIF